MKTILSFLTIWALLLLTTISASANSTKDQLSIPYQLKQMTLKEKIGQLFLVGIPGKQFTKKTARLLKQIKPGGVLLFSRNIASSARVARLNHSLQRFSKKHLGHPVFIAVDQEGDKVARIRTLPRMISPLAVGQTNRIEFAEEFGHTTGEILNGLGFNINLAPVLDLSDPNQSSFIGTRSFGKNPEKVARLSTAYMKGLEGEGVIPVAKHFPTHGHMKRDSHHEKVRSLRDKNELFETDFKPYLNSIQNRVLYSVMVAHIAYPEIDPSGSPATFSKPILTGLLRKQMKFDGLIMTDDLEMKGAGGQKNAPDILALKALKAGADVLMFAWNLKSQRIAARGIEQAISDGRISESRIDESVSRILKIKHRFGLYKEKSRSLANDTKSLIKNSRLIGLTQNVLDHHANQIEKIDPPSFTKKSPLIVLSSYRQFAYSFKKKAPRKAFRFFQVSRKQTLEKTISIYERFKTNNFVFHVTGSSSKKLLNRLPRKYLTRTIVVNSMTPGDILDSELTYRTLQFYSNYPALGHAVAKILMPKRLLASEKEFKPTSH